MLTRALSLAAVALLAWSTAAAQTPTREHVDGVTNFTRLDVTMGCAGATKASAVADLKKLGFVSIVNLREPGEEGADLAAEEAAANAAALRYYHIPFNPKQQPSPDDAKAADEVVDRFMAVVRDPANSPVFVHCAGGGRAAALWMVKRVVLDGWTVQRAKAEAAIAYPGKSTWVFDWAETQSRRLHP
ncbi:MAG: sulfur transferase domain-containing protein [Vicinamibacterales bacterium]